MLTGLAPAIRNRLPGTRILGAGNAITHDPHQPVSRFQMF
jgi:hypothetical protein